MPDAVTNVPPPSSPNRGAPLLLTTDDMHDAPQEIVYCDALPLGACGEITRAYQDADAVAIKRRGSHKRHTQVAAICGTVAVLAAIVELSLRNWQEHPGFEMFLVVAEGLALIALLTAVLTEQKYKWLAPRHRAELCRLLKFKFLITPSRWQDEKWLEEKLNEIQQFKNQDSLEEETKGRPPEAPSEIEELPLGGRALQQLVEYYLTKRLRPQKEYFEARIKLNQDQDRWLRRFAPRLFQFSVFAAIAHLLFLFAGDHLADAARWSIYAALAAACLPAIAVGVRTLRSAFEYSRNRSRFEMAHSALGTVEQALTDSYDRLVAGAEQVKSDPVLKELWWCEHILQIEHYEWLRLMVETEWYG